MLAYISCQAELVLLAVSLTALVRTCLASAYLSRVDFFKVGKIAQLNTVSHGQCMSSLLIKHWSVTDKLARSTGLAASSLTAASVLLTTSASSVK